MNEQIVSREEISNQARGAALAFVNTGVPQKNVHPEGTAAAAAWKASYERWLLALTAPEGVEGSA